MDTQKYKLHWTLQVVVYFAALAITLWLAYHAGQAGQPLAYTVLVVASIVLAVVIHRRFTHDQNPYT